MLASLYNLSLVVWVIVVETITYRHRVDIFKLYNKWETFGGARGYTA